jgi:hypothetical protein
MTNTKQTRHPRTSFTDMVTEEGAAAWDLIRQHYVGGQTTDDKLDHLGDLVRLAEVVQWETTEQVLGARNLGYTWKQIAMAMGVTKQAVQQRYGHIAYTKKA